MSTESGYLTLEQGAAYLGISRFTLDEACRGAKCAYYKIGRGRKVTTADLDAYRESLRQPTRAELQPKSEVVSLSARRRQVQM